ncbi:CocE/NonD family hydrolase [Reyranella sp.]|uniref:CocE/NonD family hydrolase n=1 Tax=Reyranella sp. TaxID=1929291 RepID=UPI0025ECC423|nr:CocE/NonD family hydrolase [Reyranella sp.]
MDDPVDHAAQRRRAPIRLTENIWIPLPDGSRLAARLWLPEDAERHPVPALLEYLPYRKRDGTMERDALTHPWLAAHGYACLRVDVRGAGESEGLLSDEYSRAELEDGAAAIAWIAAQPWCSGQVGMFGISWGGFNALQVAALRPPALKAIVTLCSTDDRYADDVHYMGGAKLEAGFGWAGFFFSDMTHPPDPALVGERWRAMWLERLNGLPLFLERWLRHQHRDAYWRRGSVCEDYTAIDCAVFAVGGWTDGYTNAVPRMLANLSGPRRGLIGPWAHAYPHFAKPGPQIGFLQEMLKWWDRWLKGHDTGVDSEPMLRAWMTGSHPPASHHETLPGRWISEPVWPPQRPMRRLFLSDAGLADRAGVLAPRPVCSPLSVGKHGGEWCPFGRGNDQADDQREDDALSLVFDTPLTATVELLGAPVLTLDLAADKPVAQIIARLCDVHPDGASLRTSFGVLNLTHRDGHAAPSPLVPGERYTMRIKLNDCGAAFPAGHRLRLALSTSYWPMVWPAPERATVTILGGHLDLPVRPTRVDSLPDFAAVETAPAEKPRVVRPGVVVWDQLDGLEVGNDWHFERDVKGDDPTSAAAAMRRSMTVARGAWRTRVDTTLRMSCTRETFRLQASVRAFEGDAEVCARDWDTTIKRDLV